jgi:hypothetical protein
MKEEEREERKINKKKEGKKKSLVYYTSLFPVNPCQYCSFVLHAAAVALYPLPGRGLAVI